MFEQFGMHDEACIEIVASAIADQRIGCVVQTVCSLNVPEDVLYDECLARMIDLDGEVIAAGVFVSHLEACRAAPMLDRHMLKLVLDRLEADPMAVLGCNISADNFADATAWGGVLHQIQCRPYLAPRLILEVTESSAIADLSFSARKIADVQNLGCRVALDDFGVGFASPRLVQLIDFDIVKIDKAFIHDIRPSSEGSSSLRHIVAFASCFAPAVVVEGVESAVHVDSARAAGATHIQGHFFATPLARIVAAPRNAEVS
ncbi:EAL domain-containing protein [Agrobacterium leguminum]|uniref:EAL domain-containing protein n=1 Tax=Agrobacterium leguminum TaxID=2792015 RepID=UPI0022B841D6|nr:EAL domain-containing protein [Agrobacterium leguminum]MCZ7935266.1 EAL domain-containing protein [Agrobacterium leguminum]